MDGEKLTISSPKIWDQAVVSGWVPASEDFDPTDLLTDQPSDAWAGSIPITLLLELAEAKPLDQLAMIMTNLTDQGTWRIRTGISTFQLFTGFTTDLIDVGYFMSFDPSPPSPVPYLGASSLALKASVHKATMASDAAFNTLDSTQHWQIEFAIKVPYLPNQESISDEYVVMEWRSTTQDPRQLVVRPGGVLAFHANGITSIAPTGNDAITFGQWAYVSIDYHPGDDGLRIYVNGIEVGGQSSGVPDVGDGSGDIVFGDMSWDGATGAGTTRNLDYLEIDEIRVWNAAHTPLADWDQEISPIYPSHLAVYFQINNMDTGLSSQYDSGLLSAVPPNDPDAESRHFLHRIPEVSRADVSVVRIDIDDPSLVGGLGIIPRLFASAAFQPRFNYQLGKQLGLTDRSPKVVTEEGRSYVEEHVPVPYNNFQLGFLTHQEVYATFYDLLRERGASKAALVVIDPDEPNYLQSKMRYGLLNIQRPFVRAGYNVFRLPLRIDDML